MPNPQNIKQLQSFMGAINYYSKFIPHLSSIAAPLNELRKKGQPFTWKRSQQEAFDNLKKQLVSAEVMVHYNPKLPLKLDCDASKYGLGAVLSHSFPDGSERPITSISRTLNTSERQYSQIEREALSIVYGVSKFRQFLYGRTFTLVTDHKPLVTLFNPSKSIPEVAADRIKRWAIYLMSYSYNLKYRSSEKHSNADVLSRLPLNFTSNISSDISGSNFHVMQIENTLLNYHAVAEATRNDLILRRVLNYLEDKWPAKVDADLLPFWRRRLELTKENGCLLWGTRIIIPYKLRQGAIQLLHSSHIGIVKMKQLARSYIWWPYIDKEIELMVNNCLSCQTWQNNPPSSPLHPWEYPDGPWQRIHVDFAGPFFGKMWLLVTDAYSKWPEIISMKSITTERTVSELRNMFTI
jgi:hypothetical protein